jgi:ribokinase
VSIVVIGSINTDLTIQVPHFAACGETVLGNGDFETTQGGKGANQAVAAAAGGLPVYMVGKIGTDAFGAAATADLEAAGVDCQHVERVDDHATGIAAIFVDPQGNNCITVAPGANACITPDDIQAVAGLIASASVVMLQLEIPVATVNEAIGIANQHQTLIMLDPAPATTELPRLDGVDYLTPNELEAQSLTGFSTTETGGPKRIVQALRERGVKNVALTLGEQGCYIAGPDGIESLEARTVQAVDSTGAGDTFNGFLATALAKGIGFSEAARIACTAASLSVTRAGARSNRPSWDETLEFLTT